MSQIKVETPLGPALFSYTISTPKEKQAEEIDRSLPTVIFLHPVYNGKVFFHYQFASPELRRFNLVALDARSHGKTIADVPTTFRAIDAAEDVAAFMDALGLPACHFFGVSLGSVIALELGISHPEKVLSLFLMSLIPWIEPELVAAGRQEIYECWVEAHKDSHNPNDSAMLDAVFGAVELGYNRTSSSIRTSSSMVDALVQYAIEHFAMDNWARPDQFEIFHTLSVKFFLDRTVPPLSSLQKITCPVNLVHCSEDIAYPLPIVEETEVHLKEADVDVRISHIPDAPHFGCATHPKQTIDLFSKWMMSILGAAKIPPPRHQPSHPSRQFWFSVV
ncbi:Alpha/Beta hydrolase protein [Pholiota molesta]|nr:Alpha/Beta hydrolase protein [Pholiota molesta]